MTPVSADVTITNCNVHRHSCKQTVRHIIMHIASYNVCRIRKLSFLFYVKHKISKIVESVRL